MKKILFLLFIASFAFGQGSQLPPIRGGSLSEFQSRAVTNNYAIVNTVGNSYAFYKRLSGSGWSANDTIIAGPGNSYWQRLSPVGGVGTSWASITDKPAFYTSPSAVRDALASLSGTNRLAYSAINGTPTFAATFPLTLTTSGTLNTFALNYTNLYSTTDSRYLRTTGGSVSGITTFSEVEVNSSLSVAAFKLSGSAFLDEFTTLRRWRSSTGEYNLLLGNNLNPNNYYRNTTHVFQNAGGGTEYARIGVNSGFGTDSPAYGVDVATAFRTRGNSYLATGSGSVGIGTNDPTEKFEVLGGNIKANGGGISSFKNGSNTISNQIYFANFSNNRAYNWQLNADGSAADFWGYSAGWTKLMSVGIAGNIVAAKSITTGVDANSVALYVPSNAAIRETAVAGGKLYFDVNFSGASHGEFLFRSSYAATTRMKIDTSGNVGIGTTSPGKKLELNAAGNVGIRLNNTTASTWDIENNGLGTLDFSRGGTLRMRIDQAGNVGIGGAAGTILDVFSTTQLARPYPSMTTTQANAIATKPEGGMYYDTTLKKMRFWNGTAYETITSAP